MVLPRLVPALKQCARIVNAALVEGVYLCGKCLYQMVRSADYWPGMKEDCMEAAVASLPHQKEMATFNSPPYIYPTEKGVRPF